MGWYNAAQHEAQGKTSSHANLHYYFSLSGKKKTLIVLQKKAKKIQSVARLLTLKAHF